MTPGAASARRALSCAGCGYDLRGRMVGDKCPECGTAIEQLAPPWWNIRSLTRIERAALWAKRASLALLLAMLVIGALQLMPLMSLMSWSEGTVGGYALALLLVLLCGQVVTQVHAVETVARQPIGDGNRRRLRAVNAVRVLVGIAVAFVAAGQFSNAISLPSGALIALWISATILLAGADFLAMNACNALMVEIRWSDTRANEALTSIAAAMLFLAAASTLMPFCGWLFAPFLWFGGLAIAFRGLERFARAGRLVLEGRT
jgi:hypothetical protein